MSQLTGNTTAFIEASQYSQFILENLHDYLLPEGMWRDVTDFGSGTTLNIKTVGSVTIQDAAEDGPGAGPDPAGHGTLARRRGDPAPRRLVDAGLRLALGTGPHQRAVARQIVREQLVPTHGDRIEGFAVG